jgi:hypothetical protein
MAIWMKYMFKWWINKIYWKCFHYYEFQFDGYLYKQKHGSHINTFKEDKINDSFKTITFNSFWKIPCIEKLFILENYLDEKLAWIEKLLTLKNRFHEKNYLHWKIALIEKNPYIETLLTLNKLLVLKNCLHWKTSCIEKIILIEKLVSFFKLFPLKKKIH